MGLDNRDWAKRIAYFAQPDAVIYAAGNNLLEWAEQNPRMAEHHHTGGAGMICNVSDILQPMFIYLSNALVFDGEVGNYHEHDTVMPTTALGKAKLGGENYVRSKSLSHVIIRAAPLLGRGTGNYLSFFDQLRILLAQGRRIELPEHEIHNYALAEDFADMVIRAIELGAKKKTYHFGGLTKLSVYDLGVLFAKRFGYDPKLIGARSSGGIPTMTKTANVDYSLNLTQTVSALKLQPLFLEQCFDLLEKKLVA